MRIDERTTDRLSIPRALALVAWIAVPVYCFGQAANLLTHFFGESATPAQEAQAAHWLELAATSALVIAVVGLLLSLESRGARWFWLLALASSAVFAAALSPQVRDLPPEQADPRPAHTACVERSGGASDCPGG